MLELLESLSFVSGALLIAGLSAVVALFSGRIENRLGRWAAAVAVPVLLAYLLYWSPVWLGADASEYSAWSLAFIVPWGLVGALASFAAAIAVRQYANVKRSRDA